MSRYTYRNRILELQGQGLVVKELGERTLSEGCSGHDVMELQRMLAEESYFQAVDGGINGYFGSATTEALRNWQRDVLGDNHATGVFDMSSRMAYVRMLERQKRKFYERRENEQQGMRKTQEVFCAGVPGSREQAPGRRMEMSHGLVLIGAVFIYFAVIGRNNFLSLWRKRRMSSTVSPLLWCLGMFKMSPMSPAAVDFGAVDAWDEGKTGQNNVQESPGQDGSNLMTHHHGGDNSQPGRRRKIQKMSREELEKRIAPMKNIDLARPKKARATIVKTNNNNRIRSQVSESTREIIPSDSVSTIHGTYFGGPQVLQSFRQRQQQTKTNNKKMETDPSVPARAKVRQNQSAIRSGSPSSTMGTVGYDMKKEPPIVKYKMPRETGMSLLSGTELEAEHAASGNPPTSLPLQGTQTLPQPVTDTVILGDKPVKLHKPSRLVR